MADDATVKSAELTRRIQSERAALDLSLTRLGRRVEEGLDWRRQVARHRGAVLAAAGGLALVAGFSWRHRRSPGERVVAAVVSGTRQVSRQACEALDRIGRPADPRSVSRQWSRRVIEFLATAAIQAALRRGDRHVGRVRSSVLDQGVSRAETTKG